jgi:hypothetical protein
MRKLPAPGPAVLFVAAGLFFFRGSFLAASLLILPRHDSGRDLA